jgi:hypothetical protein
MKMGGFILVEGAGIQEKKKVSGRNNFRMKYGFAYFIRGN